jgi:DAACS family dicarboxylate/amino acid:cation (Na+ or H+) symporter
MPLLKKPLSPHAKILLGLAVGLILGLICNALFSQSTELDWLLRNIISPIGQVFLRLIFMAVIPLIFSALALGVAELGDVRQLGRIGGKTLLFTLFLTTISVMIGLTLVNVVQPGVGLGPTERQALMSTISTSSVENTVEKAAEAKSIVQTSFRNIRLPTLPELSTKIIAAAALSP